MPLIFATVLHHALGIIPHENKTKTKTKTKIKTKKNKNQQKLHMGKKPETKTNNKQKISCPQEKKYAIS